MNLSGKINLAALEGTLFTKGKNGQDLFVIDVTKSKLFKSEKGALYLDLIAYENKDKSIETVLKELKLGHEKLISTVKTFDESLLNQSDPYYPEKHSIYTLAQHCSSLHYPWAIKFLKKIWT